MPLATAAFDARAGRRITAAAIAVALQGVFYWVILQQEAVRPGAPPRATPLEVMILESARQPRPVTFPRKRRPRIASGPIAGRNEPAHAGAPVVQPITVPQPTRQAPAPRDWGRAMQKEVQAEESGHLVPKTLQFGFPEEPAPHAPPPRFGWDHARAHRLEELPGGGTLINLTDRCGLVFYGLLIPFCRIGKIPVDGDLFEHLHDPRDPGDERLP